MAQHKSAQKRIRRTERRTVINGARLNRCRTSIRKVESAITNGDKDAASAALKQMEPELMSGVKRGVLKRNTVRRKTSRLSARVKAMTEQP